MLALSLVDMSRRCDLLPLITTSNSTTNTTDITTIIVIALLY
jgi:hypothetical protein